MTKITTTRKHVLFLVINLVLVGLFEFILLGINAGPGSLPYAVIGISVLISIPIVFFQYPLLNMRNSWIYKSAIFYLGMVTFLFLLGVVMAWDQNVGTNEAGTWSARLDFGFRMTIFGQFFGGLPCFVIVLIINLLLRKELFTRHDD